MDRQKNLARPSSTTSLTNGMYTSWLRQIYLESQIPAHNGLGSAKKIRFKNSY